MMAQDAAKHHKPDPGSTAGAGKQGRIGTSTKTLLTQHLLKQRVSLRTPRAFAVVGRQRPPRARAARRPRRVFSFPRLFCERAHE